jgi:hypothetical protein
MRGMMDQNEGTTAPIDKTDKDLKLNKEQAQVQVHILVIEEYSLQALIEVHLPIDSISKPTVS